MPGPARNRSATSPEALLAGRQSCENGYVAHDPIGRAAELAEVARQRARREREMAQIQGTHSYWRARFEQAAETHRRAADLHARAVTNLLRLRALGDETRASSRCSPHARVN